MGALKPWHLMLVTLCCALPFVGAVVGAVLVGKRGKRGRVGPEGGAPD